MEVGRARRWRQTTTVVPFMSTGATDGAQLRDRGIPTYGILLLPLYEEDELRMHGDNERTPIASLGWATESSTARCRRCPPDRHRARRVVADLQVGGW